MFDESISRIERLTGVITQRRRVCEMDSVTRYEKHRGEEHNRLTIIEPFVRKNRHNFPVCLCRCSCEKKAEFEAVLYEVRSGHTKSCGCLAAEARIQNGRKKKSHGAHGHPLLTAWKGMMARCYNENSQHYA